jgi:hypothetical protein
MTADPTGQYAGARQVIGSIHHLATADPTSPQVSDGWAYGSGGVTFQQK